MPARKNRPNHDDKTREKISTTQIINRLEKLIQGKIEMTPQQVRAADILLKKTLPDLAATQLTGPDGSSPQKFVFSWKEPGE